MVGEDGPTNVGRFINWEVQEQSFKRWNRMKEQSLFMSPATYEFLSFMDVYYSTHTV
jgi:predicted nuclease of restriction endonuclease-like (RecB) superfamily